MKVEKQENTVLEYMRTHTGITQMDATREIGVTRLAAVIWMLRHKRGIPVRDELVTVKTRYGTTMVKRYYL